MKKIFAIVLSAVLCLCMAVPAFAAGTPEAGYTGYTQAMTMMQYQIGVRDMLIVLSVVSMIQDSQRGGS